MNEYHCQICKKRPQSQSQILKCTSCLRIFHIKCLSIFNNEDINFLCANKWQCITCLSDTLPFINILDDNDYIKALSEFDSDMKLRLPELENLVFHPFQDDNTNQNFTDDIDPDVNYYNEIISMNVHDCNYYLENTFNRRVSEISDISNFSLFHLNIRSARKNLCQLENYLSNIAYKFSIIAISETWFKYNDDKLYNLKGYQTECVNRSGSTGGGVSLMIQDDICYKRREDITGISNSCEQLFIEIEKSNLNSDKNVIVGVIYRPPSLDLNEFNEHLNELLNKLKLENKNIYITGDFNVNLLNCDQHLHSAEFLNIWYTFSYVPLIVKPTRISNTNATLIDNIFTNNMNNAKILSGIFYTDISDHLPVFCIIQDTLKNIAKKYVTYRQYGKINTEKFNSKIRNTDWSCILQDNNAQSAFSCFHDKLLQLYETCFPVKKKKIDGYSNKKPWLTEALKVSIKEKNSLYINSIKNKSYENTHKYKEYRRNLLKLMKICERQYYNDLFEINKNNFKKSWKIIKSVIGTNQKQKIHKTFKIGNYECSNENIIAESFNNYFINVGPNLARKINIVSDDPIKFIDANPNTIFLKDVTEKELETIIKNLKECSTGYDNLHAKVIKFSYKYYLSVLKHLCQLSLNQGIFPNQLKIAKVIPLYKSNDHSLISNYRPVSVLPILSKIYERLMYNRIMDFINSYNILYDLQFGFRKNHSTNLALIYLIDKLKSEIDNGKIVLGVFLDLKKAFDTVNHEILLNKLYKYGIRGKAFDWIKNYLFERKQFVCFNNVNSNKAIIKCGVPQGSILGPLLFLLYINDLPKVSEKIMPLIFADDTNIFISGKNLNDTVSVMNEELCKVMHWMNINKLSLNIDKTNYIIFSSPKKVTEDHNVISMNGNILKQVESIKFLGITLDNKLKWDKHIFNIKAKISKAIGIINKTRKCLNKSTLTTLYYSFIYPYLIYCVEVWGNASDCFMNPLYKLQKRIIRIMTSSGPREPSAPLFKSLKILSIYQIYIFFSIMVVYKFKSNCLPTICGTLFNFRENYNYNTRNANEFQIQFYRLSSCQNTFRYNSVKLWNLINNKINRNCSIICFRKKLKNYILENDDIFIL